MASRKPMQISEPMTMATDYLLAGFGLVLGLRLVRQPSGPARLWGASFLSAAFAAAVGGTRHGFAHALDPAVVGVLRKTTVLAVGLASFLMLTGAGRACLTGVAHRTLVAANAFKFGAYAAWMATHDDFRLAVLDYVVAMAVVLILQLREWAGGRPAAARWIVPGLAVSFGAAALQRLGFGFHEHFNHNDLYHVVQCGALYLLYRGGRELHTAGTA